MDRRDFMRSLPVPLLLPSVPAPPRLGPYPARVVWVQMVFSVDGRTLPDMPTVERCYTDQIARGRKVLAVLYEAQEFTRIVVSQDCSSNEDACSLSDRMLAMFEVDHEKAEREYGAAESVVVLAEDQCVDVLAFLAAQRSTAVTGRRVESLIRQIHKLEARIGELERRGEFKEEPLRYLADPSCLYKPTSRDC